MTLPNGQNYATALASGALNNNFWTAHYTGLNGNSIHDKVSGGTLDGTLKFEDEPASFEAALLDTREAP